MPVLAFASLLVAAVATALPVAAPLRLWLYAPVFFWLPGRLLLGGRREVAELGLGARLGAELTAGAVFTTLLLELARGVGMGAELLPALLEIVLGIWMVIAWLRGARLVGRESRGLTDADWVPIALAVLVGAATLVRGSTVGPGTDAGMQLAVLDRVAASGASLLRGPFVDLDVSWYYADVWHRLIATAVVSVEPTPGEVVALWHAAGALVGVLTIFAFSLLATACLSARGGAIATLLFAAHLRLDELAFPAALGKGLLWGALGLALLALRTRSRGLGVVVMASASALALLHPVEAYLLGAALAGMALVEWWQERRLVAAMPTLALSLLVLACAVPLFVAAGHATWREQSVRSDPIDPSIEVREIAAGVHIVDPRFWGIDPRAPITWVALLALLVVARRGAGRARAFLLGAALVAAVGLLFPPLALAVVKLHLPTFLLSRTGVLFPTALFAAAAIASLPWLQSSAGLVLMVLLAASSPLPRELAQPSPRALTSRHPLLSEQGKALLASIPRHSVVLTDPWSADFLPAVHGHHPVAGITWHTATRADQLETRDFLTRSTQTSRDAMLLLERRRVDYVLLVDWNLSGLDWPGYGSEWQPPRAGLMMRANKHVFEDAGRAPRVELWRVLTRDPRVTLALKDEPGDRLPLAEDAPAIARVSDFDVVGLSAVDADVTVLLRARANTREAPLVSLLAAPPDFSESTSWSRVRRIAVGRPRLGHASGRPSRSFRIDNRFYLERDVEAGEVIEVPLRLHLVAGDTIRVGPSSSLPLFPLPLGPALERDFGIVPVAAPPVP